MNEGLNIYTVMPGPGKWRAKNQLPGAVSTVAYSLIKVSRFKHYVIGDESDIPQEGAEYIPVKKRILGFLVGKKKYYIASCKKILSKMQPGVVEVHNRALYFLYLCEKLPQHKHCLYIHNDPQKMRGLITPEDRQKVVDNAAAIYVVSEYIKSRYLEGVIDNQRKVHVIYNAIEFKTHEDAESILPDDLKNKKLIVFAGRMIRHKGGLELAKALIQVLPGYPDWVVVYIGARYFGGAEPTTKYEENVYECLQKLGSQARYMNSLPREDVLKFFYCAEIAVIPSIWDEPFGLTALEAMSVHTAVISSNRGGLAEVVSDKGVVVNPEDTEMLSQAIEGLISNDELRESLKKKAYDHVLANFNIEAIGVKIDNIREEI